MRLAVLAEKQSAASGTVDYARRLAEALRGRSHDTTTSPGTALDVAVYNHAPYAGGVWLGWLRAALRAIRLERRAGRLVLVYHEVFERGDGRLRMRLFERAQRWSFATLDRLADATVVADEFRAQRLRRLVPGARDPAVIPVGPNIRVPAAPPRRAQEPVVLAFGLFQAHRDLETLVAAAALARGREPALRLVLAGDTSGDPARLVALRELAERLGSPLEVTGRVPAAEVAERFAAARVFVTAYTDEVSLGSGTLAAALAYGLPVVAFEDARRHPLLVPDRTLLTAPRTPEGLADALLAALGPDADEVGRAGRRLYEEELAWERIAERFEPLLA